MRLLGRVIGCFGLLVFALGVAAFLGGQEAWSALRAGDVAAAVESLTGIDTSVTKLKLVSATRDADRRWTIVLDYAPPEAWDILEFEITSVRLEGSDAGVEPLAGSAAGEAGPRQARRYLTGPLDTDEAVLAVTWHAEVSRAFGSAQVSTTTSESFPLVATP